MSKKRPKGKKRGRPKGSTTRGPTVAVGVRFSKDLFEKVEALRRHAEETLNRTLFLERLVQEAVRAREAATGEPAPRIAWPDGTEPPKGRDPAKRR